MLFYVGDIEYKFSKPKSGSHKRWVFITIATLKLPFCKNRDLLYKKFTKY